MISCLYLAEKDKKIKKKGVVYIYRPRLNESEYPILIWMEELTIKF